MPYVGTNWVTGDTITAVLFNKCESQYAAASNDYAPSTFTAASTANLYLDPTVYTATSSAAMCIGIFPIPYWVSPNSSLRISADMQNADVGGNGILMIYTMPSGCVQSLKVSGTTGTTATITAPNYYVKGHNYGTVDAPCYDSTNRRIARLQINGTDTLNYDGRYIDLKVGGMKAFGVFFSDATTLTTNVKNLAIQHDGNPTYATTAGTPPAHCGY